VVILFIKLWNKKSLRSFISTVVLQTTNYQHNRLSTFRDPRCKYFDLANYSQNFTSATASWLSLPRLSWSSPGSALRLLEWLLRLNTPIPLTGFQLIFWQTLSVCSSFGFGVWNCSLIHLFHLSVILVIYSSPLNFPSLIYGCQFSTLI
jgi:hypothetical protein